MNYYTNDLGIVYGPYGGIGFAPRLKTKQRRTSCFGLCRWIAKVFL